MEHMTDPSAFDPIETMKREIDALQIAVMGATRPWYKNISLLVSVTALVFSFGTTYVSYRRTAVQDIQSTRQELRALLQRLSVLPRENVENAEKYGKASPSAMMAISGFINQENSFLVRQAAELAKKLPEDAVSAAEYYALATAFANAYEFNAANEFLDYTIRAAKDFNVEVAALRTKANVKFVQGHAESGRVDYQKALDVFSKYQYQNYDASIRLNTNFITELAWANSEAAVFGPGALVNQHADNAERLLQGANPSPMSETLRAQLDQAKERWRRDAEGAGVTPLPGAIGPSPPVPKQDRKKDTFLPSGLKLEAMMTEPIAACRHRSEYSSPQMGDQGNTASGHSCQGTTVSAVDTKATPPRVSRMTTHRGMVSLAVTCGAVQVFCASNVAGSASTRSSLNLPSLANHDTLRVST
jgi:hypothetical protein